LATGNWKDGWAGYEHCLGGRFRKIEVIGDESKWDGSPVDDLYIYGEQGLGDELMYASIIPDAIPRAKRIVLDCDKRIRGLLQRSFPSIEVRGTRREAKHWAVDREFNAGCAMGSLAWLFRPDRESCPKKPYLIADPERRLQWRALFDSWKKPVIGIAWTGGKASTQRRERQIGLEAFRPFIEGTDAVFVSLQYTDADDEIKQTGLPVKHIHRAVQSPDYDDTAAFVAELDRIVGIHTTIHHLAGALGKPSTILVPEKPMWNYATGDGLPWYAEQRFHRQRKSESWSDCIKRLL
jgi:ADP-heptose:LPS heptosyltransferase